MWGKTLLAAALLVTGGLLAACGGDGDHVEAELTGSIGDLSGDLESSLDGANIDELDENARLEIDEHCSQLAEEAADTSVSNELTDLCGDIRQALTEGSQDGLDEARQRLDELSE